VIVESVIYDENKYKVVGVRVINTQTGESTEYFARVIFLCASTLASTAILMNSKISRFSEGLANSSGVLGHYLMDHHKNVGGSGILVGFEDRVYKGYRPAQVARQEMDFLRGYGLWGGAYRQGINGGQVGIGPEFKQKLTSYGPWRMSLGTQAECLPYYDNKVEIDEDNRDKWGQPMIKVSAEFKENEMLMRKDIREQIEEILKVAGLKNIQTYQEKSPIVGDTVHEMGTARMGRDPKTSVLNGYNQCHDIPNLFVTDGSCMASSGNASPSLTYMALTVRACDYAVKQMKAGVI